MPAQVRTRTPRSDLAKEDESLFAFRLLCESWMMIHCGGTANYNGITIHSPEGLGQWLAPFGEDPSNGNAIEKVVGMIGGDEIKDKAKKVLELVNGNGVDLKAAIVDFLGSAAAKPSA